jgi:hypothetical protein
MVRTVERMRRIFASEYGIGSIAVIGISSRSDPFYDVMACTGRWPGKPGHDLYPAA